MIRQYLLDHAEDNLMLYAPIFFIFTILTALWLVVKVVKDTVMATLVKVTYIPALPDRIALTQNSAR